MTELSDSQMRDLVSLATERVSEALTSVDQLVEDPEQSYLLQLAVIANLCQHAAEFMAENTTMPNGERPTPGVAFYKVLELLVTLGDKRALIQFVKERKERK